MTTALISYAGSASLVLVLAVLMTAGRTGVAAAAPRDQPAASKRNDSGQSPPFQQPGQRWVSPSTKGTGRRSLFNYLYFGVAVDAFTATMSDCDAWLSSMNASSIR